jgi:4-amino-4-deoxy-L-arabinose transferase-like glycosyltransferase
VKRLVDWCTATPERLLSSGLLFLLLLLWVPLAGCYGLWDPWESHYSEVARQMLERNDWVSLWWPGSPQDRAEFWSKPVLTFWLMALGMKLGGLEWGRAAADEMTASWRVEWAVRLPIIALSIVTVWFVFQLVRRLAGLRAGLFAALVLATASQWVLITRQAMTDLPFVAPMTIALCLAGLGLLLPEEERELELPRRQRALLGGRLRFDHPDTPAFTGFLLLFFLTVLPQLVTMSVQVKLVMRFSAFTVKMPGLVAMLPYFGTLALSVVLATRVRNRRQLYLLSGYVLCGLASLAKGPAGIALPAIVLVVYLAVSGRLVEVLTKLEIPRGVAILVTTAFPWYHSMLVRHGMGFWNEFIGDNYVHRAGGRHGDRGLFDYYFAWLGSGASCRSAGSSGATVDGASWASRWPGCWSSWRPCPSCRPSFTTTSSRPFRQRRSWPGCCSTRCSSGLARRMRWGSSSSLRP